MLQVNKIYFQLKTEEISKEEASSLLLAEIFKSPRYYCMDQLAEDEISGFLLWIYEQIPKIIDNYKNKDASFLTYYTSSIRYRYRSWKRQNAKQVFFQKILDNQHYLEHNENPCELFVGDQEQIYCTPTSKVLKEPLTKKQATTILVLALKSFRLLSDKTAETIPWLTGVSAQEFSRYVKLIESKMNKRLQNFEKMEKRKNASYILYQQYTHELTTLDTNSCQYNLVLQKHLVVQNNLNRLRTKLKQFNLQPTNKMVEEVLSLPEGSVRRILAKADKQIHQVLQLLDPRKK